MSGTSKAIRSRYRVSRMRSTRSSWKLTTTVPSLSLARTGCLRKWRARFWMLWLHSTNLSFSKYMMPLAKFLYLSSTSWPDASLPRLRSSRISSKCFMVFRVRRKRFRLQAIAPAFGGWFLLMGGVLSRLMNISCVVSTSRDSWVTMSANLSVTCLFMTPLSVMPVKFCRSSKAPSALRSFLKLESMNALVTFSIWVLSSRKRRNTSLHMRPALRSKRSKLGLHTGSTIRWTRRRTLSTAWVSPVTALSSGPRSRCSSSTTVTTWCRSWHTFAR